MSAEIKFQLKWLVINFIVLSLFVELLKYINCYNSTCYLFTFIIATIINNLYSNAREKFTLDKLNRKGEK